MDDEEFYKYVMTGIVTLYPHAAPEHGRWVVLKLDSGPGRLNNDLLARLRFLGFLIFPGVPNTTAVSQETDWNYSAFKTQFLTNLALALDEKMKQNEPLTFAPWMVPWFVYGGFNPDLKFTLVGSAYQEGFSRKACRRAWEIVGAVSNDGYVTRSCLTHKLVRRSIGDGDDKLESLFMAVQETNDNATHFLTQAGFNGDAFKSTIVPLTAAKQITVPHTQERIELLARAATHGMHFNVTGGATLSSHDHFKSVEFRAREVTKKKLDIMKKIRQREERIDSEGRAIIEMKGHGGANYLMKELDTVLKWYATPKLGNMNKEAKLAAWTNICEKSLSPPTYTKWTEDDELKLVEASNPVVEMRHTALGRMESLKKRELTIAASKMTDEEFDAIVKARDDAKAREESMKRKRDETEDIDNECAIDAFDPDLSDMLDEDASKAVFEYFSERMNEMMNDVSTSVVEEDADKMDKAVSAFNNWLCDGSGTDGEGCPIMTKECAVAIVSILLPRLAPGSNIRDFITKDTCTTWLGEQLSWVHEMTEIEDRYLFGDEEVRARRELSY